MAQVTTDNLKRMLSPRDRDILDAQAGTNWVPKEPRELILTYVEKEEEVEDRDSIDFRRKKAKEVYDGYGKIIEDCKELEAEIEEQCKDVKITLNPATHLRVIEAVQRIFPGSDGKVVTFEMYKKCIKALSASSNNNLPLPTDKGLYQ
jgi:hypothetical protein